VLDFKFKPTNGIACMWLFFLWLRDENCADAVEWLAIVAVTQISAIYKGICMLLGMPRTTKTTQPPTYKASHPTAMTHSLACVVIYKYLPMPEST